ALAGPLPACAESIGFECALARGTHGVDLGVSLPCAPGFRDALAGWTNPREIARLVDGDARWGRIRAFVARWGETPTLSATRMPFMFLELDADGPRDPVPVPSLFVALDWLDEELTPDTDVKARRDGALGLREACELAEGLRCTVLS